MAPGLSYDIEFLWTALAAAGLTLFVIHHALSRWLYLAIAALVAIVFLQFRILLVHPELVVPRGGQSNPARIDFAHSLLPLLWALVLGGIAGALQSVKRQMNTLKLVATVVPPIDTESHLPSSSVAIQEESRVHDSKESAENPVL